MSRQDEVPELTVQIAFFLGLLILVVFVLPSVGMGDDHELRYSTVAATLLFGSGLSIAWRRRRLFVLSAITSSFAIATKIWAVQTSSHSAAVLSEIGTLVGVLVISWVLMLETFRRKGPVTASSIQSAVAVYLLFGLAWANAYVIAMQQNPHSFQGALRVSWGAPEQWIYFSFTTLTTLGYGDITPLSPVAHSLAVGEALTGQLYLTVLLGRLIGKEMSYRKGD